MCAYLESGKPKIFKLKTIITWKGEYKVKQMLQGHKRGAYKGVIGAFLKDQKSWSWTSGLKVSMVCWMQIIYTL